MKDNGWFTSPFTRWSDAEGEEAIRKNAVTPHPCSGYCCGNPRKWFGEATRQEVIASMRHREQLSVDEEECEDHKDLDQDDHD